MGTFWTSYAVIGVKIPVDVFKGEVTTTTTPSCGHPEREGKAFCPICGTKVCTKVSRRSQFEPWERSEELYILLQKKFGKEWLVSSVNEHYDFVIAGMGVSFDRDKQDNFAPIPDLAITKANIGKALEEFGLDSALYLPSFGLHGVTVGS